MYIKIVYHYWSKNKTAIPLKYFYPEKRRARIFTLSYLVIRISVKLIKIIHWSDFIPTGFPSLYVTMSDKRPIPCRIIIIHSSIDRQEILYRSRMSYAQVCAARVKIVKIHEIFKSPRPTSKLKCARECARKLPRYRRRRRYLRPLTREKLILSIVRSAREARLRGRQSSSAYSALFHATSLSFASDSFMIYLSLDWNITPIN